MRSVHAVMCVFVRRGTGLWPGLHLTPDRCSRSLICDLWRSEVNGAWANGECFVLVVLCVVVVLTPYEHLVCREVVAVGGIVLR